MSNISLKAAENLQKIRETKPLIHNITNCVVMNYTANVLLAMGASPVMAHVENEVEDMVAYAGSLVLNIANGHPLMPYVTGTGCSATAIIGAFAAVDTDYIDRGRIC